VASDLALCLYHLQDFARAIDVLAPRLRSTEHTPADLRLAIRSFHAAGRLQDAVRLIDAEEKLLASDADGLGVASLAMIDVEQMDRAARLNEAALAGGSACLETLVAAGTIALARDDAVRAKQWFEQALTTNARDGRSWSGLGLASLLIEDLTAARRQLTDAVKYMPAHIGSWQALGWAHFVAGDTAQAAQAFEQALRLDRNFGESHGALAVIQATRGERAEAAKSIQRAAALDRGSLSAQLAQLILAGRLSNPDDARREITRLLRSPVLLARPAVGAALARRLG
jgi:tetratricopeptide (TPR) repeat protein